jgi:peroxidase
VTSFAQISSNVTIQKELQQAYGTVDNIDPFEGGLAEDHAPGSDMGPLFTRILVDQFTRLRGGDRFFYLNESLSPEELNLLHQADTLTKVIEANTNITNMQPDAFIFASSISGTVAAAPPLTAPQGTMKTGPWAPPPGLAGMTVQLKDDSGTVLATTTTDRNGHYRFNQQSGVAETGTYSISLVLPSGASQTSPNPTAIQITSGNQNVADVNFQVAGMQQTPPPPPPPAPWRPSSGATTTWHQPPTPAAVDAVFGETSQQSTHHGRPAPKHHHHPRPAHHVHHGARPRT